MPAAVPLELPSVRYGIREPPEDGREVAGVCGLKCDAHVAPRPVEAKNSVTRLWFEPGGCSVVPSSLRAWAIMPAALPMSRLHVLGERVRVSYDRHLGVLADAALLRVDSKSPAPPIGSTGEGSLPCIFPSRSCVKRPVGASTAIPLDSAPSRHYD